MGPAVELVLLRNVGVILLVTTLVSSPVVLWFGRSYRRARCPVPGAPVALPGGSYRGVTVRPMVAGRTPWVAFVALQASLMGAVFVAMGALWVLWSGGELSLFSAHDPLATRLANVGSLLSRFALLWASVAVLVRSRRAHGAVVGSVTLTLATTAAHRIATHQSGARGAARLDAALYEAGFMLTALLVAWAWRSVARSTVIRVS